METFSDRECIFTGNNLVLSAEDVLSCSGCGDCNGGSPWCAFEYWLDTGVVTEDCYPYELPGTCCFLFFFTLYLTINRM